MKLPSGKHLKRFLFWLMGRLLLAWVFFTLRSLRLVIAWIAAIFLSCENFVERMIKIYDSLLSGGAVSSSPVIADLASYIDGRQIMLIAEMGAGKSTLVKYLIYSLSASSCTIYECEGVPGNWGGFQVIGAGADYQAINFAMKSDIEDLENRIKQRNQHGDMFLKTHISVVEEFPEIIKRCSNSIDWIDVHSRRGNKAKRFSILISQYDKVSAWGLEGKSDLADSYVKIRLGKKAINHARKLNDNSLVAWLEQDTSHILVDDLPCKIPAFREMQAISAIISNQLSVVNNSKSKYWEIG